MAIAMKRKRPAGKSILARLIECMPDAGPRMPDEEKQETRLAVLGCAYTDRHQASIQYAATSSMRWLNPHSLSYQASSFNCGPSTRVWLVSTTQE